MIRRTLILLCALLPLTGCAALHRIEPDSAGVVVTHVSHITQHNPLAAWLGHRPTNYGYQTAGVAVSWYSRHRRWRFEMSDGWLLPDGWLPGPHEVFGATLGYTFWRKSK
jgi:hypothetical protein